MFNHTRLREYTLERSVSGVRSMFVSATQKFIHSSAHDRHGAYSRVCNYRHSLSCRVAVATSGANQGGKDA